MNCEWSFETDKKIHGQIFNGIAYIKDSEGKLLTLLEESKIRIEINMNVMVLQNGKWENCHFGKVCNTLRVH